MPPEISAFRRCVENAFRSFVSEKQMPTASTFTTSWVGPGSCTGLARLWTSRPGPTTWIACWVAGRAATGGWVWFIGDSSSRRGTWGADRTGRTLGAAAQLSITWPPVTGSAWPVSYRWATR